MDTWELAQTWAKNPAFDPEDRLEIKNLLDRSNRQEIEERFYRDLEFGTGGLRAIMGMGRNRMSKYSVRRATHALCLTIAQEYPQEQGKVAIGYDSRKNSKQFAQEVAKVVAGMGMRAYLYQQLGPVALLSWAVRYHHCHAGVMVTASHNPPKYNGYKAFWSDGAQVTPPIDGQIIRAYQENEQYDKIPLMDFEQAKEQGLTLMLGEETEGPYYQMLLQSHLNHDLLRQWGPKLKIAYTPIHGTGLHAIQRALQQINVEKVFVVESQAQPDGDFPTVKSPNPENPEALALVVELMKQTKADCALGTDPDTDRLGVAYQDERGDVHYLNGNQIAILLLHYALKMRCELGRMPPMPYVIKTIVTSELQTVLCRHFGVEIFNTLTGFKWICRKIKELEEKSPELNCIFSSEESFGYLPHNKVRDKDGIAALTHFVEMMAYYKSRNLNLTQALDEIYDQYGFSYEELLSIDYEGKDGAEKIQRIMQRVRHWPDKTILNEEIAAIDDVENGTHRQLQTAEVSSLDLPSSNVLGLHFSSGNKLWLRPSGTEPKIKFYYMIQEANGTLQEKKARALEKAQKMMRYLTDLSNQT